MLIKPKKQMKLLPLYICVVFLIIWGYGLIRCEVLTHKYHEDFENAYQANTMLDEMEYFKVLDYDNEWARVYYVSRGMTEAHVLTFKKEGVFWEETSWKTIWSASGSASDVIWPYWWHFIYGGL